MKCEFESAADYRDKLYAVERISQRQKVSNISENDIDVIGIARSDQEICIEIFYVRNSKMIGRDNFFFKGLNDETDEELTSEFIERYYTGKSIFPNKIMCRSDFKDRDLVEQWLTAEANRKVEIKVPKIGEKIRLVEMAESNAKITLDNKEKSNKNVIVDLKDTLGLDRLPRRIESYDISNISGEFMVAGMCVMIDGQIKKNLSRRFKIKTVFGQDDPRCMEEVITRRLRHSIKLNDIVNKEKFNELPEEIRERYDESKGFGKLPDLILADGGITQIRATKKAIKNIEKEIGLDLNIGVYGMVKNDKHQTRALMNEERKEIEISEDIFNLITNFQNEVHNTAIGYHKFLRDKSITKSKLDEINGIGSVKKMELLKKFGSVERIEKAEVEEIANVKGIGIDLAKTIKKELEE